MPGTTGLALFDALCARAERPALRFGDSHLSYAELAERCKAHSARLSAWGVAPGDRVAIWTHPAIETLVALVCHAACGYVSVPLNPALGAAELDHILRDASPRVLLSAQAQADSARTPHRSVLDLRGATEQSVLTGWRPPARDAPALILYTSGTTGAPKGAVLTTGNVAANLDGLIDAWALSERDTIVHALPVFHAHGLVFGLFGALRAGACLHWTAPFDPHTLAAGLEGTSTVLFAVPTILRRLCDAAETDGRIRAALGGARLLVSGSAALPEREHARIERLSGQRPVERYGLTETLINTAIRHDGERRAGHVGVPLKGVELRLVDDARKPIPTQDGTTLGEVAVRGPHVFSGYLNRPDATSAVRDAEGWFYTGDLGTLDATGYLRLLGRRATDLIKTGGFKVGAGEVEGALLEHEAVSEVAVVGVADEDLGERIEAYVVLHPGTQPTAESLIEHCMKLISKHKRPRRVHFVSELPRNAMGKVQKKKLTQAT